MKIALCVLVLAVSASAASNGNGDTHDVNWSELENLLGEMNMLTKNLFDYTVDEAKQGNPEIGNEIDALFKKEMPESRALMNKVVKEITEKTLTHDKAKNYLEQFKVFMQKLGGELQKYLSRFPPANSENIGKKVGETIGKLHVISHSMLNSFHQAHV